MFTVGNVNRYIGRLHHFVFFFQVDDIKAAMKDLKEHNIRSLNTEPKVGLTV